MNKWNKLSMVVKEYSVWIIWWNVRNYASKKWWLILFVLQGGTHKNWELSSGGGTPCSIGFPHQVSVLGTHPYQCASWCCWESLASVNFFWRLFQCVCPFLMGDLQAHLPTPPQVNFFLIPGRKKSSKGNILLMWKRWNKKL